MTDWLRLCCGACGLIQITDEEKGITFLTNNTSNLLFYRIGNGTARFKKHKQLFDYKHLFLLRDILWLKF
jgi:hypothetical protein